MSLRTKLLATAIGLPLAVLLASLALVRQADRREYTTAEAMLDLFERGQRSTWREFGRAVLGALDDGLLERAWVFRWARDDTNESQDDLWTAEAYFSEDTGRLTESDLDADETATSSTSSRAWPTRWRLRRGTRRRRTASKTAT